MTERNFVREIICELESSLSRAAVDPNRSEQIVSSLEEFIRIRWGAHRPYVTRHKHRSIASRNEAVLREFNGRNHREVCRRHGISKRTLYRILKGE